MLSTEELSKIWDDSHKDMPTDRMHSQYAETVVDALAPHSDVCDLGGGTGADALFFAQAGHTVTLYDISPLALRRAEESAKKVGLEIIPTQADFGDSKFFLPTEAFDFIYSRMTLHYFNPGQMNNIFNNIYNALRLHGKAMLTLKSPNDLKEMEFLRDTAHETEPGVFEQNGQIKTRFTNAQLLKVLKEAGLPERSYSVKEISEDLSGRGDSTKSGNMLMLLNEITITK